MKNRVQPCRILLNRIAMKLIQLEAHAVNPVLTIQDLVTWMVVPSEEPSHFVGLKTVKRLKSFFATMAYLAGQERVQN